MTARFRCAAAFGALLLLLLFALPSSAEGAEDFAFETREELRAAFPDLAGDPADPAAVAALLSPSALWETLSSSAASAVSRVGPCAAVSAALLLLSFAASLLFPQGGDLASRAVAFGGTLLLWGSLSGAFTRALDYFAGAAGLSSVLAPIFGGLYAAGGAAGASAAAGAGLFAFCSLTQFAAEGLLSPLLRFLLVLSLLSAFTGPAVREIGKTVRAFVGTLFALFSALLPAALGFQTALAASGDSMAARAARFAVGQMPVVGGAISGAFGTLASSLSLLQTTAGGCGFAALFALSSPVLSELLLLRLLLSFMASLSAVLDRPPMASLFGSFREMLDLFLAGTAAVTVALLLELAVLSRCTILG